MSHKKIGIENFRIFKDYTEFEIRPITLLTGPNNSGKSSFTKLILLLQEGMGKLNFDAESHNLASYDNILNWDTASESLIVRFSGHSKALENLYCTFQYKDSYLEKFKIETSEVLFLEAEIALDTIKDSIANNRIMAGFKVNTTAYLNLKVILEIIYSKNFIVNVDVGFSSDKDSKEVKLSNLAEAQKIEDVKSYPEHLNDFVFDLDGETSRLRNSYLFNKISELRKDYLLFEVSVSGEKFHENNWEYLLKLQEEVVEEIKEEDWIYSEYPSNFDISQLTYNDEHDTLRKFTKDLFGNFLGILEKALTKKLNLIFKNKEISITPTPLARFVFKEVLFEGNTLIEYLLSLQMDFEQFFRTVTGISANRAGHQRALTNQSSSAIDKIIFDYSKLPKYDQQEEYLQQVFEFLEIDGELKIDRLGNSVSLVYLERGGKKISIADLGYGYSQLIPIILQLIILKSKRGNYTFIIEEPEANLHPNLQSKLASILVHSRKTFGNISFIVETHSEYLIRKLQFLTAEKKIDTEDSVIYYFNADKYVSREEPKIKKIEITGTGNLTDSFGPGFLDESTRLQFDLMKINKEQKN